MNGAIFNLLLPACALSSGYVSIFLTISLIGSAAIIFSITTKSPVSTDVALVYADQSPQTDQNMYSIMLIVFTRIAKAPILRNGSSTIFDGYNRIITSKTR